MAQDLINRVAISLSSSWRSSAPTLMREQTQKQNSTNTAYIRRYIDPRNNKARFMGGLAKMR